MVLNYIIFLSVLFVLVSLKSSPIHDAGFDVESIQNKQNFVCNLIFIIKDKVSINRRPFKKIL